MSLESNMEAEAVVMGATMHLPDAYRLLEEQRRKMEAMTVPDLQGADIRGNAVVFLANGQTLSKHSNDVAGTFFVRSAGE